ncbi:serine/threonine protein kinase [Microbulbifer aggregans]|uniref:serine/threonine protein kinase n=1 Tax=Microbulbifer aggregans TaxID=1769779 RepID=UPI001CFDBE15|nr:serine/threonine-protein kinase [Microbulbifer aggregans]
MNQGTLVESLGLDANATPAQIQQAITQKVAQLEQALENAPTDALRQKYKQQLQSLEELSMILVSESGSNNARPSSLSQTKLADLPQSATQFDGANTAQITLQAGQVLANRYEIREQIGAGGMGAVYHAYDSTKQEDIALKVLLPSLVQNERARQRFLDEARVSSKLSHPNIVNVFDVQQDGDFFFLTMELLEGQDLRQLMEVRKLTRQPFDEGEARTLAATLANALAYAHQHTVHRDIKPENIWVTEDGDYKIMDFGIARVQSTSQRTQTGAAMGTAYYMAPEQLKGTSSIDGRADQYALGVLLYELLAGEVPAGRFRPLRELRKDLGKRFATNVEKALETRPEDRFSDMAAFAQAMQSHKGGGIDLNLPRKGIGIAAGVLVALLGIGGLAANGNLGLDSLKSLLPMSKEEIAAQKASLAKIQGEIKVLKQRLETSRRNLDNDVRDAERANSSELASLRYWQRITESGIFAGSGLTELEGDLAMAEALIRDNVLIQAEPILVQVRADYQTLRENFNAAEQLFVIEKTVKQYKQRWIDLDLLQTAPLVEQSNSSEQMAQSDQAAGNFANALAHWEAASAGWQKLTRLGEMLIASRKLNSGKKQSWLTLKQQYDLAESELTGRASSEEERAESAYQEGSLHEATSLWNAAAALWADSVVSAQGAVKRVQSERNAAKRQAAEAEARRREEAKLAAENAERQRQEAIKKEMERKLGAVLDLHIQFLGGRERLDAVKQLMVKSQMDIKGTGKIDQSLSYGDNGRYLKNTDFGEFESSLYREGTNCWDEEESTMKPCMAAFLRASWEVELSLLLWNIRNLDEVEYLGKEGGSGGENFHVVSASYDTEFPDYTMRTKAKYYLDSSNGQLKKLDFETYRGDVLLMDIQQQIESYREYGGLMFPYRQTSRSISVATNSITNATIVLKKVSVNGKTELDGYSPAVNN